MKKMKYCFNFHPMNKPPRLLIAFGNKARSGKDEACNFLIRRHGGVVLRIAEPVYQIANTIQAYLGLEVVKNPRLLQHIGRMRDEGVVPSDIFVNRAIREFHTIDKSINVFIPDLRYKNEMAAFKALGFTCVRIDRPSRPIDRDPTLKSETDLDDCVFDEIIKNDGSLAEYYTSIKFMLRDHYGVPL